MRLLENYTFTIAVLNDSLFTIDERADGTLYGRGGLNFIILECLALQLGFRYRLVVPEDNQYGLLSPSGTWNGIVEMLVKDEVDFTASNLYVTPEREKAVNFSLTCNSDNIVHITKTDPSTCGKGSIFILKPFQSKLWIFLCVFCLMLIIVHNSIRLWIPKFYLYVERFAVWSILRYTIGLGYLKNLPTLNVSGIILLALIIYLGCIMRIYGFTLTSSVNLKKCDSSMDNLDELVDAVEQNRLTLGIVESHGLITTCLKNSKISKLRKLGRHLDGREEKPFAEAFRSIRTSNYALVIDVLYFAMLMDDNKFSLLNVNIPKKHLFSINMAMAYAHSFKFNDLFNKKLGRIKSSGLFEKFRASEVYFLERDLAVAAEDRRNSSPFIGITDLQYAAILLCLAFVSGFFLVVFERSYVFWETGSII